MNIHAKKTCAIVVTYHPDPALLQTLMEKLSPQVGKILTIDNTINNVGLGAAYNKGIEWAKKNEFEYVMLFDQDSCPTDSMVTELHKAYQILLAQDHKIAAVGPQYIDARTNIPAHIVQLKDFSLKRCFCTEHETTQYIPAAHIISSGSLISIQNLEYIGLFDESLFIDHVDVEWGLRAGGKGYQCFYICPAILYHRLGEKRVRFFGRFVPVQNSLRCFYEFRNITLLSKRKYIPLQWKVPTIYRSLLRYLFYAFFSESRLQHIKMMSLGVWHGLLGRVGQYLGRA